MFGRRQVQWEEMIKRNAKNLLDVRKLGTMARHRDEWEVLIKETMVRMMTEESWEEEEDDKQLLI